MVMPIISVSLYSSNRAFTAFISSPLLYKSIVQAEEGYMLILSFDF